MGVSQENDIWVRAGVQVVENRVSLVVAKTKSITTPPRICYVMSQHGTDAEKQRCFAGGHRLLRAMDFELSFAQISCDHQTTLQFGTFDFMKLLKPAVSTTTKRGTRCTAQV